MRACVECGYENPDDPARCWACGATLGASRSAEASPETARSVLDEVADRPGNGDLFPQDVLEQYRLGRRLAARARLLTVPGAPELTARRRLWANALRLWGEPTQAPSMFTLNGVGARLHGRHQPASDGTYVAILSFVILFVPVSTIAAYLVSDGPAGWRRTWMFHGKVPAPLRGVAEPPDGAVFPE